MEPNGIQLLKCISESNENKSSSLLIFKACFFLDFYLVSISSR